MNPVLKLVNLSIGQESAIVDSINAQAFKNELIVLTGENGIGKSTLLKTIAGIIKSISGEVFVSGDSISMLTQKQLSRKLAFASTQRIKEDYIKIEDVVRFGQFPYQQISLKQEENKAVDNAIAIMGIDNIRHKYLNQVSDGEWQKANIARVLAQKTDLILMDEPTAFLDYPSRMRLFRDLKNICATQDKTIIISTHDIESVKEFASVYWHINQGKMNILQESPIWRI
jgi:iron complex transport system ATP-binding protein